MDYIVWSRIIGPLAIMIFVIYVIISSNRAVKELVQKKSEANNQVNASVKNESALPSFVEDYQRFPLETGSAQEALKTERQICQWERSKLNQNLRESQ